MQSPRRSDLNMDPCNMHIFKRRYYNINRNLLMCLGLWPYEIKSKMYIIRIAVIGTLMLFSVPQLIDVIVHTENVDRQMMGIIAFLTLWIMTLKMIGMILAEENTKRMHRSIANNWQLIQEESEREILHKYSERARTGTIVYFVVYIGSAAFACTLPSIPKILDRITSLEDPRPEIYLIEGEYFIEKKGHFVLFFLLNYFEIMFTAFICVAFETMYIVSVEHCCALYAVVRSRLLMLRRIVQKSSSATEDGDSYEWLLQTIQLHQRALAFTSSLNDSYSITFLFVLIVSLFVVPLACCAIISQLHNPLHLMPYALYSALLLIQGFFIFGAAQRIINHQLSACDAAYCNEWYTIPLRTRKLLLILMLRCSEPSTITAGGLLEMNFENYFKIAKTAFSYVTVASSFR